MSVQYQKLNSDIVIAFLQEKYDIYLEYFNISNDTIMNMTQKEKRFQIFNTIVPQEWA